MVTTEVIQVYLVVFIVCFIAMAISEATKLIKVEKPPSPVKSNLISTLLVIANMPKHPEQLDHIRYS